MAKKKETSFFQKIVTGVTGRTPEQRHADAVLKSKVKEKQMTYFRQEQLAQAENVGRERARVQARQQINQFSQPQKSLTGIDIGTFGKLQQGFDPLTFGAGTGAFGKSTKAPKVPSTMQIANMQFPDYTKPMKSMVVKKMKHKRRKKKVKGSVKKKKQSFTITMK